MPALPAVRWLPAAGANYGAPADLHELALAVELPAGWHAAGAGRTHGASAKRTGETLRFEPDVPITEFALLAAPLERRAMTIRGIECELLIHPKHLRNVEYLAAFTGGEGEEDENFVDELRDRLGHWLLSGTVPAYPHRVFSLVEVPAQLRRYGGGWLMDTVQALPGVQLLAEHGLPTARLAERHSNWMSAGPRMGWLLPSVDYSGPGGIPLHAGAARNAGTFLAQATGEGAAAADYLLYWLTARQALGFVEVAPAHWLRVDLGPADTEPYLLGVFRAMAYVSTASRFFLFFPMSLEDQSEKMSFTGFDPASTENGADVLIHKANLIALSIHQLLGARKVTQFLALMHERHAGGTYALDDFAQALIDVEPALAEWLHHVLHEPTLPGFHASDASVHRLPDDDSGRPRYQILVHVRNDELAPGVAGVSYRSQGGIFNWSSFTPMAGESSVEIGVVSAGPPEEVRLETYLSLNRRIMRLRLELRDVEKIVYKPPFTGTRASAWMPPDLGIVVDDLDAGFAASSPPAGWSLGRATERPAAGLPEFGRDASSARRWRRQADPNVVTWGRYRRTLARIAAGDGTANASFTTALPSAGRWRLHYHLPGASLSEDHYDPWWNRAFGAMDIKVISADAELSTDFDAAVAAPGWNSLGTFDLPAGRVQVVVSDATTGDIVVADAVRWERLEDA